MVGEFAVGAEGGDLGDVELLAPGEFAFPDRVQVTVMRVRGAAERMAAVSTAAVA
ncbi:hypothetical protein O3X23_07615 [Streptomyces sp. H39-S7]|nr:hypothetical protein [Streptomyces sp. H39-S7]MCZ4119246.1 hypothetical protein [Streptomyces sp. H39-S7]